MKYILTIDTDKKEVCANLDYPIFLRTGDECLMEVERRKRIISEYANANLPDWYMTRLPTFKNSWNAKLSIRCVVIHDIPNRLKKGRTNRYTLK